MEADPHQEMVNVSKSKNIYKIYLKCAKPGLVSVNIADAELITQKFCDVTEILLDANKARDPFWFTFIASRDRQVSLTFNAMHSVAAALGKARSKAGVWVACELSDPLAASTLAKVGQQLGLEVGFSMRQRVRCKLHDIANRFRAWALLSLSIVMAVREKIAAIRLRALPPEPADVLIFTLLHGDGAQKLQNRKKYQDRYFGELPQWLAARGSRVSILGPSPGSQLGVLQQLRDHVTASTWFRPTAIDTTWADILAGCVAAAFARWSLPPLPISPHFDLRSFVQRDLRLQKTHLFRGRVLHRVARRALARHQTTQILHVYENHAWERSTYLAAREAGRTVGGYLHCALLRSHLMHYCTKQEWRFRPRPDRIVTTGPDARNLLLELGDYPAESIVAACALRDPSVREPDISGRRPPDTGRILILLEGLMSMAGILRLSASAAERRPALRFEVRSHPVLPARRIAEACGLDYGASRLCDSDSADLTDDIMRANVIVYQGTTAALAAAQYPRPLLRAAMDPRIDDDPLTGIDLAKWEVKDLEGFLEALDEALSMPASELASVTEQRRKRVLQRWAPIDDGAMAVFADAAHSECSPLEAIPLSEQGRAG
ncbi:MAG: hypothetical protein ACTS10_14730 [Kiloniellales bacterium]